jgi:hypothetical protein
MLLVKNKITQVKCLIQMMSQGVTVMQRVRFQQNRRKRNQYFVALFFAEG